MCVICIGYPDKRFVLTLGAFNFFGFRKVSINPNFMLYWLIIVRLLIIKTSLDAPVFYDEYSRVEFLWKIKIRANSTQSKITGFIMMKH